MTIEKVKDALGSPWLKAIERYGIAPAAVVAIWLAVIRPLVDMHFETVRTMNTGMQTLKENSKAQTEATESTAESIDSVAESMETLAEAQTEQAETLERIEENTAK